MCAFTLVLALCISGCEDEKQPEQQSTIATTKPDMATGAKEWLDVHDDVEPGEWLLTRGRPHGREISPEELRKLRHLLDDCGQRFGESQRMIANRAVQIEGMLRAMGISETAPELLKSFLDAVGERGQTEGFGSIGQHYVNLRRSGISHEAALSDLRRRYGPRRLN